MNETSVVDALVIKLANAVTHFHPSDFGHLFETFVAQISVQSLIGAEGIDSISHCVDVPIIYFDDFVKNLPTSRLLRDDGGGATLHGLKRGYANRFGIRCPREKACALGKVATNLCKQYNFEMGRVEDPRFGTVKTYPDGVLRETFERYYPDTDFSSWH